MIPLSNMAKGLILAILLGVSVTTGLSIYINKQNAAASKLQDEANRLRGEAQEARRDAAETRSRASELQAALDASLVNSAKIKKELDKIKVPPPPENPPTYVADIVTDLTKWGLTPLVGASNTVGRSAFGIKKDETQILWKWGYDAQRVQPLEFKLQKTNELVTSITNDRDLAVKLSETKTLESDAWMRAADKHRDEADKIREEVTKVQKAMSAERKKKYVYAGAALVLGGLAGKALSK
jgi:peptidoglycan hydrolase CwlO-like protein